MTTNSVLLPARDGTLARYTPRRAATPAATGQPPRSRRALSAVHVVADPLADTDPVGDARLDWDATMAFRHHVWSQGLGVAEAMDTAQRGGGLNWALSRELIERSAAEAKATGGWLVAGAGTDHLSPTEYPGLPLDGVEAAYAEQCAAVEGAGAQIVLMASRALAAVAGGPDDYARVYGRVLSQVRAPVIIHWLGDMFDPLLAGYWGSGDLDAATETCLAIMTEHAAKIDGIKVSLLDKDREIALRRRLPAGVRMYTGDDFHFPELIRGDEHGHSDALLGIFDPIAPVAAAALRALDAGDTDGFDRWLAPTVPLARHCFSAPTPAYKTGVVFLAWMNGHQEHFRMVGGAEGARSVVHLAELFRLADTAGLLRDPELACERMRQLLTMAGIVDE